MALDPKIVDRLEKSGGKQAAETAAIMMLMAREASRDPKFVEEAERWMDRSLASLGIPAANNTYIEARKHFQSLLVSARKMVAQKTSHAPLAARVSWWQFWKR